MPTLEVRTAKQTSKNESDERVPELPKGIARFRGGGVALAALDRPMQAELLVRILNLREAAREARAGKIVQRTATEQQTKNQACGFYLVGRCA